MEQNLTQGSVKKHYFHYLGAALGSAMIACVYGLVDAAVVGQYKGPVGTAALSVVMPIWTILYSLGLLIGAGGAVCYSVCKASGKPEKANAFFTLSLLLVTLISVICELGLTIFDDELLHLFGANDVLAALAKEYLLPIKFVVPVYPFSMFLSFFLLNDNAPGRATFATLFGGVFNIFGDIFFVFGLDLGVFGAGLATAIGGVLPVLIMLSHFFTKRNTLKLSRIYGALHKSRLVIVNGFSSFVLDVAMGVIAMMFNRQVMHYLGADALAVFGVIVQVTSIVQCSSYSIGQASQPILSANYGAGEDKRIRQARQYAFLTAMLFGVLWTASVLLFPNGYVHIFMSPTAYILEIAPAMMRIYGSSYLLLPLNIFSVYYFQSVMRSRAAFVISLGRGIVISGILIYFLPMIFGADAIWFVMPITEVVIAGCALGFMKKGKKRTASDEGDM